MAVAALEQDEGDVPEIEERPFSPIEVAFSRIPKDHFILDGINVNERPHYTVSEVAKVFFARSAHWIRLAERNGKIRLDGVPVLPHRKPGGARYYTLEDVEKLAHALVSSGAINVHQLAHALVLVQDEAYVYGYLNDSTEDDDDGPDPEAPE